MKKIIFAILLFGLCISAGATELSRSLLGEAMQLYVCTEQAPVVCKYFNLTKDSAKNRIKTICDSSLATGLEPVWENGVVTTFVCKPGTLWGDDDSCRSMGYDCAIDSVCVEHGQVRPGARESEVFLKIILPIVSREPESFVQYPEFYYVCPTK